MFIKLQNVYVGCFSCVCPCMKLNEIESAENLVIEKSTKKLKKLLDLFLEILLTSHHDDHLNKVSKVTIKFQLR